MAKGNRLVVAGVVVVALIAAGNSRAENGDDDPASATSSGSSGASGASGASDTLSTSDSPGPAYGPVPGQQEKDQEPGGPAVELVADPVEDECVLTAPEVQGLIEAPVERTVMTSVPGADGRPLPGCVAVEGENQLVLMNVYRVSGGSPADAVRRPQDGARPLDGVGEAAALVPARVGPTLQVAGQRFLVTIEVAFRNPSDDAWRAAGAAALDRVE